MQKLSAGAGITVSMGTGTGRYHFGVLRYQREFHSMRLTLAGTIDINTVTASGAVVVFLWVLQATSVQTMLLRLGRLH